ncbi:MAG: alcohol dehydrogenase catalytic domain-containing protein [Planctomycetota bacterium]
MKGIVFLGNRRCEVREFPKPEPGVGEVLIRVEATGICGSDLHVYRGEQSSDQIRGHEPCGVVEAIGPAVTRLKAGDRVTVHHHVGCGKCPECAEGEVVACSGGKKLFGVSIPGSFAEYTVAVERNCIPLPDTVSFIDGAFMACVGGTAYGALRRLDVRPCESLAVFGLGPVGLSCVILGKALGARVAGIDVLPERLNLGKKCGADEVVDAGKQDVVGAIKQFSRVPFRGDGVDCVIETSGATPARQCIIPSLRRLGRAAIVGVGGTEKVINPTEIHGKACTLIGSVVFRLGWMWDLARFLALSSTTFEPAATHRFSLDDAVEAFRLADEGRCGKVVFLPHGDHNTQ